MSVKLAALALSLLGTTSVAAADARRVVAANGESGLEFLATPAENGADLAATAGDSSDAVSGPVPRRDEAPSPFGELALKPRKIPTVDESALRYYAAQKDRKRVDAEIRRIKFRFPKWLPPGNLYTASGTGEGEQPLWDLFGAGKLEELRAKIAQRMAREPNWSPSFELRTKIERRELRDKLIAASESQQWAEALTIARGTPEILSCADIDAVWRIAEASARLDDIAGSSAIYRSVLSACTDPDERLATVRKALGVLPMSEVQILISLGGRNPDGSGEFDAVKIDISRTRLGAISSGKVKDDVTPEELQGFSDNAVKTQNGADTGLVGWYYYSRKDWAMADVWFRNALQWTQDVKLAEGHALTLYKIGLPREAERVSYEWRERSVALRELYIGFVAAEITTDNARYVVSAERLSAFTTVAVEARSPNGAQALAWYHFIRDNAGGSVVWFKTALDYAGPAAAQSIDPLLHAKIAEGYALSLHKIGHLEEAEAVAYSWRDKGPELKLLYLNLASELLRQTNPLANVSPEKIEVFAALVTEGRFLPGAQALAWRMNNAKRFDESVEWFKTSLAWSPDGKGDAKTNEGYALALQGAGRLEEAEAVAFAWIDRAPEMRALYIVIMVAELTRDGVPVQMPKERLARFVTVAARDKSANAAQALGWYHHGLKQPEGSLAWFKSAIDWSSDGKGNAKMNEGYALALKTLDRLPEAEAVTWAWAARALDMRKLYTTVTVAELTSEFPRYELGKQRLANFVEVVAADKSGNGAQALGWHHFARDQFEGSLAWFRASLDWAKTDGAGIVLADTQVKAAEGYALSLQKLDRIEDAAALAYEWRDQSNALRALYIALTGQLMRRPDATVVISTEAMEKYSAIVTADKSALGAQSLGWFHQNTQRYAQAVSWFETAIAWSVDGKGDAKTSEGYVLALKGIGRLAEAEAIAFAWQKISPDMRKLYVLVFVETLTKDNPPARMEKERLANFVAVAVREKSMNGAQALGWYHNNLRQYEGSLAWFRNAIDWSPDGKGDAKMNEGYALALKALDRLPEAETIIAAWADRSADMRKLYATIMIAELTADNPRPVIAAERLAKYVTIVAEDRSAIGAQAIGWHHYLRGEYAGSLAWFRASLEWVKTDNPSGAEQQAQVKAAEGYALTLQKLDRFDDAETLAFDWRDKSPTLRRLYIALTGDLMRRPNAASRISQERFDQYSAVVTTEKSALGAQSIGWFLQNTQRYGQAVQWFETAIAWSPDKKGDAKTNEGYALVLKGAGRLAEAEAVTYAFARSSPDMSRLYTLVVVEELTRDNPPKRIEKERLANFVAVAAKDRTVNSAQALGWYHHNLGEFEGSVAWFRNAIDWSPGGTGDAKMNEGYALALKELHKLPEAETVAWTWAPGSEDMRRLYETIVIAELTSEYPRYRLSKERLSNFTGLVAAEKSAQGAQALGWHHFMREEYAGSLAWFRYSLDWARPDGQTSLEARAQIKAAEGYALSLQKLDRVDEAEALAYEWRNKSPTLRALYFGMTAQMLRGANASTIISTEKFDEFSAMVTAEKSVSGAQALGWFLQNTQRHAQAIGWFESAIAWSPEKKGDAKTNEGYALALKANGKLTEAEEVTYAWHKASDDMKKLYILVVVEELTKDSPPLRMPKERLANFVTVAAKEKSANGAQALGWYHHNLGQYEGSVAWFKYAIDWSPEGKGTNKMVEGYGLSLKALVFLPPAELVTYPWVERDKDLRELYKNVVIEEMTRENPPPPIPEPRVTNFVNVITPDKSWQGAQALGWYRFNRKEWQLAADWFYTSLTWAEPLDPESKVHPKTAEGFIYALRNLGRIGDALAMAFEWRERWPSMRPVFIALVIDALGNEKSFAALTPEILVNFETLVKSERSFAGAQALAWFHYNRKEWQLAADWFKVGLEVLPSVAGAPVAAATAKLEMASAAKMLEGYVMAMRALGRLEETSQFLLDWRERVPAAAALFANVMAEFLSQPAAALSDEQLERLVRIVNAEKSVTGAYALGWYLNRKKDYARSFDWFKQASAWPGARKDDPKAAEGTALALMGLGRYAEAEALELSWRDKSPEMHALYVAMLINQLSSEDPKHPVAPERLNEIVTAVSLERNRAGAQVLGWYYSRHNEWPEALDWFKSAVAFGPKDKTDPKLVEGQAIALRNLGRGGDAFALISEAGEKEPALRNYYIELAIEELTKDNSAAVVPLERLSRHASFFTAARSANGAQAMGWYRIAHKEWAQAAEWFKSSIDWSKDGKGDVKMAEGYAIALQNLGRFEEAERIVAAFADKVTAMRGLFVDIAASRLTATTPPPAVSTEQLKRYATAIVATQSANGAQALAWYSYNIGQYQPAAAWFDKAMSWQQSETSAVGLALTYRRLNNAQDFTHIINLYRGVYPKVAEIVSVRRAAPARNQGARITGSFEPEVRARVQMRARAQAQVQAVAGATGSILAAFKAKDSVRCIGLADAQERVGRLSAADSLIKGWCLMEQWRPQEAAYAFDRALILPGAKKDDAAYGKSLALLRGNATEAAAYAANQAALSPERRTTIGIEVLTQRAQAAYRAAHYAEALGALDQRAAFAPEQRDLMMLRGWSLYSLGHYEAANRVFMTVDRQLSSSDSKKALAAVEARLFPQSN